MKINEVQVDNMFPDHSVPIRKLEDMYFDYTDNGLYVKNSSGQYIRIGGTTTSTSTSTSTTSTSSSTTSTSSSTTSTSISTTSTSTTSTSTTTTP